MWIFNQNKTMFVKCDTVFIRQSMNNKDLYEIRGRRAGREGSDILGVYDRVKAHNIMAQFVDKYKPDMLWIMPKE